MKSKFLVPGQSFIIPNLKESIRNAVCLRVSFTSVYYTCELKKGFNEDWKREYTQAGTDVEVEIDESKPIYEVFQTANGELDILTKDKGDGTGEKKARGRGRKAKEMVFPTTKFTVPAVAKELDVSTTNVYLRLQALIKEGKAKVVEETPNPSGRGKKTKWYLIKQEK